MKKIYLSCSFLVCSLWATELDTLSLQRDLSQVEVQYQQNTLLKTPAASRLGVSALQLPMQMTSISAQDIKTQQAQNLFDVAKNVTGVYAFASYGGVRNILGIRGFGYGEFNYIFNDVRVNNTLLDMQGVEEINFLKGASAIEYGVVSPGGLVAVQSKKPFLGQFAEANVMFKVYENTRFTVRPTFDVNTSFGKKIALRLNGAYENGQTPRTYADYSRYYLQPALTWFINPQTELTARYEGFFDNRTPDNGTIFVQPNIHEMPQIYDLPWDKFLGFKSDIRKTATHFASLRLVHLWSECFSVKANLQYNYESINDTRPKSNVYLDKIKDQNGMTLGYTSILKRALYGERNLNHNTQAQIDFVGKDLKHGVFSHNFQVGADWALWQKNIATTREQYVDRIDVLSNTWTNEAQSFTATDTTRVKSLQQRLGLSMQHHLGIGQYFKVLWGLRYTGMYEIQRSTENFVDATKSFQDPNAYTHGLTPNIALMAFPLPNLNVFASYTRTFRPSTALDIQKKSLNGDYAQQAETGVKWAFWQNKGFVQAAYYFIFAENSIVAVFDEQGKNKGYSEKTGSLRNQGVEIELGLNPLEGLQFKAGYTFIHARYGDSYNLKPNTTPFNTPDHLANLSATYTWKGLSVGLYANYIGKRFMNDQVQVYWHNIEPASPTLAFDPYWQMDAQLGYSYKGFSLVLKANNVTGVKNYQAYRINYINPIEPRNYILTISYKWSRNYLAKK